MHCTSFFIITILLFLFSLFCLLPAASDCPRAVSHLTDRSLSLVEVTIPVIECHRQSYDRHCFESWIVLII
ncbi:hypothetical protein BDV40DRAFT_283791 [Aspergillus tamarii]|uniref:Secreted protein n=1 Tax=Aspergillus tamarii TaxID=41984 RepID=A0A5N6UA07_ASPTM|nr:hypothetical protein BDV40DRAFT_283791 [Aspergillus tamarii]